MVSFGGKKIPDKMGIPLFPLQVFMFLILSMAVMIVNPMQVMGQETGISITNVDQVELLYKTIGTETVGSVSLSLNGQMVAAAVGNKKIKIYKVSDGTLVNTLDCPADAYCVAFSPDGKLLAAGLFNGSVKLWGTTNWGEQDLIEGGVGETWMVGFAPDNKTLAFTSGTSIKLWDITTKSILRTLSYNSTAWSVAFSLDGQNVAAGFDDGSIKIWKKADGSLVKTLPGPAGAVYGLAYSPDGSSLVSSGNDCLNLWKISDGSLVRSFAGHAGWTMVGGFSPDGSIMVSSSQDTTIKIWKVDDGSLLKTIQGHTDAVGAIAFNGSTIISGSHDKTLKIWGIENNIEEMAAPTGVIPTNREWTISFNSPINMTTANQQNITVKDASNNSIPIEINAGSDTKKIKVKPTDPYPTGTCTLFLKRAIESTSGRILVHGYKMQFNVTAPVVINSISADTTTVGKVTVVTAAPTTLAAIEAGITIGGTNLSWKQSDTRTFVATISGAVRGQQYTFNLGSGFTLAASVHSNVSWEQQNLPFTLSSTAFSNGSPIPSKYAMGYVGGSNVSPALGWQNAPAGTKSFALLVYDPDGGYWVHWAVSGILPTAASLPEGASHAMPAGSVEYNNEFGDSGYGGPGPPSGSGVHHYHFVLYALNTTSLGLSGQPNYYTFTAALTGKVIGQAEIIGTYQT